MSPAPPAYPRTPYLWSPGIVGKADSVLPSAEVRGWLDARTVVEEKLDGANVAVWWDDGRPAVASRGGPDAMDRAGQLGPLRAWVGRHLGPLAELCAGGWALYGEWLWLQHTVGYDALPDLLVVLDLHHADIGFAPHDERRTRVVRAGLVPPPVVFEGVLGDVEALLALIGTSRFGHEPMEGLVLRRDATDRCKVVRPGFVRAGDDQIARTRNALG